MTHAHAVVTIRGIRRRTPDLSAFTRRERGVILAHRTPRQVQGFLRSLPYNWERSGKTLRTFRGVVRHREANCIEAALTAATILEQHGWPPLILDLESQDQLDHELFLYCWNGRWGTVARSRDLGLHGRRPVFRSVRDLVMSYIDPYVDGSARIVRYGVGHLDELVRGDWRLSDHNVWEVERALIEMSHRRLHTSDRRYRRMRRKYLAFRQKRGPLTPGVLREFYGPATSRWW